jgi:hypothetical protein
MNVVGVLALAAVPSVARAAEGTTSSFPSFTGKQLDVFAEMVAESREVVARRLYLDPSLAERAVEAAEQRTYRLRSGKRMAILGFAGLGAGVTAAVFGAVLLSNDCIPMNGSDWSCSYKLVALELLVLGAGGALAGGIVGLLGLHKLDTPTPSETAAKARYELAAPIRAPTIPPAVSPSLGSGFSGKVFTFPLVSVPF